MTDYTDLSIISKQTQNELLEKRIIVFATTVVRTVRQHPSVPRPVSDQLIRSAASIGANYVEACNASSRLDFRNKIFIAKKEAAETRYWIDFCAGLTTVEAWRWCRGEAQELLLILQAIANGLKK